MLNFVSTKSLEDQGYTVKKNTRIWTIAAAGLVALVCACDKTVPNVNDTSVPEIVIKVKGANNQYEPATDVSFVGQPIDVMAIATDAGGIKFIKLFYVDITSNSCTTTSGAVCSGSFSIPVPGPVVQNLQPDSEGKVLTKLPLLLTISGPFACKCQVVVDGDGKPIGHTMKLRCTAQNWSSNAQSSTAEKDLSITVKG